MGNLRLLLSLPSGKRLHNYGKSPFFMGKLTISMAMFNSLLYVYQRVPTSNAASPIARVYYSKKITGFMVDISTVT